MATWKVTTRELDGVKTRGIVLPNVVQEDFDHIPSAAYGSTRETDGKGVVISAEVPEDRFLPFDKPGKRLERKAIVTVKAHTPDGRFIQVPFEDQINNHIASPESGLGIQPYVRKGYTVYWDPATGKSLFCQTWGCHAEANYKLTGDGFCSEAHQMITRPPAQAGSFSLGATTSTRWAGQA